MGLGVLVVLLVVAGGGEAQRGGVHEASPLGRLWKGRIRMGEVPKRSSDDMRGAYDVAQLQSASVEFVLSGFTDLTESQQRTLVLDLSSAHPTNVPVWQGQSTVDRSQFQYSDRLSISDVSTGSGGGSRVSVVCDILPSLVAADTRTAPEFAQDIVDDFADSASYIRAKGLYSSSYDTSSSVSTNTTNVEKCKDGSFAPSCPAASSSSSSLPVAAIGGAVGGLVVILVAIWCFRSLRNIRHELKPKEEAVADEGDAIEQPAEGDGAEPRAEAAGEGDGAGAEEEEVDGDGADGGAVRPANVPQHWRFGEADNAHGVVLNSQGSAENLLGEHMDDAAPAPVDARSIELVHAMHGEAGITPGENPGADPGAEPGASPPSKKKVVRTKSKRSRRGSRKRLQRTPGEG